MAPWRSLQPLTPDATQLADPTWAPQPFTPRPGGSSRGVRAGMQAGVSSKWQQAADWARQGRINNLSLMALDVLMAPQDAKDRWAALVFRVQTSCCSCGLLCVLPLGRLGLAAT